MQSLIEVVNAVEAYLLDEAKQRIPKELRDKDLTFFSITNLYRYMGLSDGKLCNQCAQYDGQTITGAELRSLFPWLEVDSANIIYPRVHPNCRCLLIRYTPENSDVYSQLEGDV